MFIKHATKPVAAYFALLLLSACTAGGNRIGSSVTLCCPGSYNDYQTYSVETYNMPMFLRAYVIREFDSAFQEKGVRRTNSDGDLTVKLSYKHVALDDEQYEIDPFTRTEDITLELHYVAIIDIQMLESESNEQIWQGNVSKIHHVSPGEYMHEDRARDAFLQAFRTVLNDFPLQDLAS